MVAAGFEPANTNILELESSPLDHSGKLPDNIIHSIKKFNSIFYWVKQRIEYVYVNYIYNCSIYIISSGSSGIRTHEAYA